MARKLSKPTIKINNEPVPIVPNSCTYTEGEGETMTETESVGGGKVQVVTSDSAEDKLSDVKFEMMPTEQNIAKARGWKKNPGGLVIALSEDGFSRSISQASLTNNYEVALSSDGKLSLEFSGASSI